MMGYLSFRRLVSVNYVSIQQCEVITVSENE